MRRIFIFSSLAVALFASTAGAATIFLVAGSVQQYTVAATGYYDIVGAGGQGGSGSNLGLGTIVGGNGALIEGNFLLNAGTVLDIYVGQRGFNGLSTDATGGGGGGATFILIHAGQTPLLVAGGGGGGSDLFGGGNAGTSVSGGSGSPGSGSFQAGAGAGFNGGLGGSSTDGSGLPNLTGGTGFSGGGNGGYGGGGGAGTAGGGGAGYKGGNAGACGTCAGGGGGSFVLAGTIPITAQATQSGDGFASIAFVGPAVPEPGTFVLFGLGLTVLVISRFRRVSSSVWFVRSKNQ